MKRALKVHRLTYYFLAVLLLGSFALSGACTHRKVVKVGSHQVTVSRHGIQKSFRVTNKDGEALLEYEGINTAGNRLHVSIEGEQVIVNGENLGTLRKGDDVLISDEGVAVNSMDYGETEKYLRANSSSASTGRGN